MMKHSDTHIKNKNKGNTPWLIILHNEAVVISFIYTVFGVIWILLSDILLEYIIPDDEQYKHFQTYKGWFYILITTLMLYLLIRSRMRLLKNENRKTTFAYKELSLAHEELISTKSELDYQIQLTDSIISEAPVLIVTHSESEVFSHNPMAQKISGYTLEELNEKNWMESIVPAEYWDMLRKTYKEIREQKKSENYEYPIISKDGTMINVLWNSNLLSGSTAGKNGYFVSFGIDISERTRYEEKVKQLAFYDSLTGLPNRAMFENEVNKYINSKLLGESFIIAYIDIDNFKNINDSMGHQVGDLFLTYLGERLREEVSEPNFIARLGGDEFAILFLGMSKEEVIKKINALILRVNRTWTIENHQFYISMSVGVVIYPEDGETSTALLKNADIAMYSAKSEGKSRVLFYKEDISADIAKHLKMINNLQYGIDDEQFILYYQPQYNLKSGKIIGAEALVRWVHPVDGFIPPGEFIPLAEESGQIYKLERWIISKALEQKKEWEELGFRELVMSINLSGKTLTSSINFLEIEQIIADNQVDYSKVVIEITETASISDVGIVINHLNALRKWGIKIALDDFGTGYSSLNYLKMFPINYIKLDRSFINAINENGIDLLLIKNILSLARDLQFEVIAEGIETGEQLEFLKEYLCETGQGYLFSRPVPVEKLYTLINEQKHYINP